MFGRSGKIKRAIEQSQKAVLAGDGDAAYAPIEKLRDGEKVDAYVDLCHGLIFEEDLAAADAAIDRALALAPQELYVLDAKAEVAKEDGRHDDAVAIYRTMYEIAPHDPAVLAGLSALLLAGGDAAGAVELLEPHADSPDAELHLRRGEALYAAGRPADALEVLERVCEHYGAALKTASFVDNPRELASRLEEAARLREDVFAELQGGEAAGQDAAPGGDPDERAEADPDQRP